MHQVLLTWATRPSLPWSVSLGAYFLAVTLKPLANASQYACVYEYQVEVGERERIKIILHGLTPSTLSTYTIMCAAG